MASACSIKDRGQYKFCDKIVAMNKINAEVSYFLKDYTGMLLIVHTLERLTITLFSQFQKRKGQNSLKSTVRILKVSIALKLG